MWCKAERSGVVDTTCFLCLINFRTQVLNTRKVGSGACLRPCFFLFRVQYYSGCYILAPVFFHLMPLSNTSTKAICILIRFL